MSVHHRYIFIAVIIVTLFVANGAFAMDGESQTGNPLPYSTQPVQHDDEFNGCVARFDSQALPSSIRRDNFTAEKYNYSWFTLNVPHLFSISKPSWENVIAINTALFTNVGLSEYKQFIEHDSGFKDFLMPQKGDDRIVSFFPTAPRLTYESDIKTPITNGVMRLVGRRWIYKAIVHSTYLLAAPVSEKYFLLKATVVYSNADDTTKIESFQVTPISASVAESNVLYGPIGGY